MKWKSAEELSNGMDLSGKTVLITGCNSGIGYETMRSLSMCNARIIGLARTYKKAYEACKSISNNYLPVGCEMSDFMSIQKAISGINEPIDVIIANAGVMWIQEKTLYHHIEGHLFVNHLAHFAIVNGLLKHLTSNGRVIVLSSAVHAFVKGNGLKLDDLSWNRKYSPWTAYAHSKLANLLFVRGLATRLKKAQTVNAVHPGIIESNLWRNAPEAREKYNLKSTEIGAITPVYLAVSNEVNNISGQYFTNCKLTKPSAQALDDNNAQELWERSSDIIEKSQTIDKKSLFG